MSKANKNIEEIFKEKLNNHDSVVKPDLWNSISNSLPAAAPTATAIALKTKILVGIAASIITAATVYYFVNSPQIVQNASPQKIEQSTAPENSQNNQEDSTASAEIQSPHDLEPSKKKTVSKNNAVVAETLLDGLSDQVDIDLQNSPSDHTEKTTMIEEPETSADVALNTNNTENLASNPTEVEKAAPPVMQVKEVDNSSLLYFLFSPQKASAYEWWIDNKLVSNSATFNHNFESEGNHFIRLVTTSAEGKKSEETQNIEAYRNISFNLPNAFSPNGDGMNDVFNAENGIEHFQKIDRLLIRDKNGKSIFESSTHFIWDGSSMDGNLCPSGVYTYTIFATDNKNNPQMKAGTIQLFVE